MSYKSFSNIVGLAKKLGYCKRIYILLCMLFLHTYFFSNSNSGNNSGKSDSNSDNDTQ